MIQSVVGRVISSRISCCGQLIRSASSHQYLVPRNVATVGYPRLLLGVSNHLKQASVFRQIVRKQCTSPPSTSGSGGSGTPAKLSLFAKFKQMYKDYWYVMLPVHLSTSACWFGMFYKVSSSGVDVGYYLRYVGVSDNVIKHVTESGLGHVAVAWALYKIATPIRYAVTLGGTTYSINVLRNMGYIKPAKELMAKGRNKIQSIKDKQLPKN